MIVDASVWVAAFDTEDRFHGAAQELIRDRGGDLAALDLTLYEVANVSVVRAPGLVGNRIVDLVLVTCDRDLIRVDPELIRHATQIAADNGITAYDAAYVAAARRRGTPLVSTDMKDLVHPGHAITPESALAH